MPELAKLSNIEMLLHIQHLSSVPFLPAQDSKLAHLTIDGVDTLPRDILLRDLADRAQL